MTYTAIAMVAVLAAVALDQRVARTRLTTTAPGGRRTASSCSSSS